MTQAEPTTQRSWRFQHRPTVVESVPASVIVEGVEDLPPWCVQALRDGRLCVTRQRVRIVTLDGMTFAFDGDMVTLGTKGELYPIKPHVFADAYDPIP